MPVTRPCKHEVGSAPTRRPGLNGPWSSVVLQTFVVAPHTRIELVSPARQAGRDPSRVMRQNRGNKNHEDIEGPALLPTELPPTLSG